MSPTSCYTKTGPYRWMQRPNGYSTHCRCVCYRVVDDRERAKAFAEIAYAYFDTIVPGQLETTKYNGAAEYQAPLMAMIHKALLKSDSATIRAALLEQYGVTVAQQELYITYNRRIDIMLKDPLTDTIYHMADRQVHRYACLSV